jgi:inorganic pyrophosphatase
MPDPSIEQMFGHLFRSHPWHGVSPGDKAPALVNAYIEIAPSDVVKYELDKVSGHLRIDRPQQFSSQCPSLYGFIPQTFCGPHVADVCAGRFNRKGIQGDGDPIDICVLTERPVAHGDIFVSAKPIGGLRMIDGNEADDKIIAVLESDTVYGALTSIKDCPQTLIERISHYFLSYKQAPGAPAPVVEIMEIYDQPEACHVIEQSMKDYLEKYGEPSRWIERIQLAWKG